MGGKCCKTNSMCIDLSLTKYVCRYHTLFNCSNLYHTNQKWVQFWEFYLNSLNYQSKYCNKDFLTTSSARKLFVSHPINFKFEIYINCWFYIIDLASQDVICRHLCPFHRPLWIVPAFEKVH